MKRLNLAVTIAALILPISAGAQDIDVGKELFNQYCATCHGTDGGGTGPLTELIIEKPADLRHLAKNNVASPGEFPMLRVIHVIDGRTGLRAHGGPMPTYGNVFMAETIKEMEKVGAVLETRGRILSLAMYLESIQD